MIDLRDDLERSLDYGDQTNRHCRRWYDGLFHGGYLCFLWFDVTLWNHRKPTLERAKTLISETSRDKIHYTTNLEDIAHLDIVIENVTEDMAIKEGFYESFCKMADADMILATNTSGLSINALAQFVTHRERF